MLSYSSVISKVMDLGLDRINNNSNINIEEMFRKAANGENRTVEIVIYSDAVDGEKLRDIWSNPSKIIWRQGMSYDDKNKKIVKVTLPKYTVVYKTTLSVWYRLVAQQNTFRDLWWSGKFDAEGEYFARDLVVWGKFWEQYKEFIKLSMLEKLLIKQKEDD